MTVIDARVEAAARSLWFDHQEAGTEVALEDAPHASRAVAYSQARNALAAADLCSVQSALKPNPDAALLDLCRQLDAQRAEWQRLYDLTSDDNKLVTPADHEWATYSSTIWPGVGPLMTKMASSNDLPAQLAKHRATTPWQAHVAFEHLHPFMDGNGRTGRALWAWHMIRDNQDPFALGFLHRFYYQTLAAKDHADA